MSSVIRLGLMAAASGIAGCYLNTTGGATEALKLDTAMHQQMARGDLAGIYNGADQRYRDAVTREKSDALYAAISKKLGSPMDCVQGNTTSQVATWGTTITSACTTKFSKDASGVETFVWIKSGDQYKLLSYHINSTELMER